MGVCFCRSKNRMDHVGPFTYNGVRFLLGALSLLPLILFYNKGPKDQVQDKQGIKNVMKTGFIAGTILFLGASLQQIGLLYTTAGKAAFITCLYIVLVPLVGIFLKQYISMTTRG